MYLEEPAGKVAVPLSRTLIVTLVPALVCAVASVLLMRAGFFTFFFLVPLGVCAVVFGPAAAWLSAVFASLGSGIWFAGFSHAGLYTLGTAVQILGFAWLMAGNPRRPALPPVRTVFRFIAAAAAGALVYLAVIFSLGNDAVFSAALRSQIEVIASSYIAAAGTDAAQRAFMEQTLTADRIIDIFMMIILRGGALFSTAFLLFFNRQLAFTFARLFRRQQKHSDLIGFHAPRSTIWVFSLCLPVILLGWITSLELVEIAAWNILVMCATMFLAQGGGIALFYLARRPMPMLARFIGMVLFVCVIFSPGINVLALTILLLLGIAENWLPLRVAKQEV